MIRCTHSLINSFIMAVILLYCVLFREYFGDFILSDWLPILKIFVFLVMIFGILSLNSIILLGLTRCLFKLSLLDLHIGLREGWFFNYSNAHLIRTVWPSTLLSLKFYSSIRRNLHPFLPKFDWLHYSTGSSPWNENHQHKSRQH